MPERLTQLALPAATWATAAAWVVQVAQATPAEVLRQVESHGLSLVLLVTGLVGVAWGLRAVGRWAAPRVDRWLDGEEARRERDVAARVRAAEVQAEYAHALAELRAVLEAVRALVQTQGEVHRAILVELRARPCLMEAHRHPLPEVPPAHGGGD